MITASVVTFNTSLSDLDRLFNCIEKSNIDLVYIIDNSPNDSLRHYFCGKKNVRYIHSLNVGYGAGHNIAIKQGLNDGSKYHVVINPDTYWTDDVIGELTEYMESNSNVGQVMPKICYPNGETQYLCKLLPTPSDLICRRFLLWSKKFSNRDFDYELRWTNYNRIMEVPSLSGCFMFLRSSILKKTKGFDERFFMYAEDLDLCRRIGEVASTVFYPDVTVYHEYEKGSYKNFKLLRYHVTSIIKYFNKWGWIFDKKRTVANKTCIERLKNETN